MLLVLHCQTAKFTTDNVILVTESYTQDEIDIDKYRKLSSKFPGVKEQWVKPFPWLC